MLGSGSETSSRRPSSSAFSAAVTRWGQIEQVAQELDRGLDLVELAAVQLLQPLRELHVDRVIPRRVQTA